jgi:alanyl-tRNA synthetase
MQRKQVDRLQEELLTKEVEILLDNSRVENGVTIVSKVWENLNLKNLQKLASMIANGGEKRVVLFGLRHPKPTLLFGRSLDLTDLDVSKWISQVAPLIEGRGGGTPDRAQAGGNRVEGLEEALRQAGNLIDSQETEV